jgi:RES domain-containing protein
MIEIEFDVSLVWPPSKLPADWKRWPYPRTNEDVGDSWLRSGRSAVLRLPSATVPEDYMEYNYLLNPAHPDFGKIKIGKPRVFKIDPRLGPVASR